MWTTERAGHKTSKTNTENGRKRHTDIRAKWQEEWDSNNNNTSIEWFHFGVTRSTKTSEKTLSCVNVEFKSDIFIFKKKSLGS